MAREALLTINCNSYSSDIVDIIKLFNHIGWVFSNNQMEYLPLKDNDLFGWKCETLSYEKLFSIVSQKQINNELIGIILYYNNTDIGIKLLTSNTKEINICLDINRVKIDNEYTDISWYILKIVVELEKSECIIEEVNYSEYIG